MTENRDEACGPPAAAASEHMSKKGSDSNLGNMCLLSAPKLPTGRDEYPSSLIQWTLYWALRGPRLGAVCWEQNARGSAPWTVTVNQSRGIITPGIQRSGRRGAAGDLSSNPGSDLDYVLVFSFGVKSWPKSLVLNPDCMSVTWGTLKTPEAQARPLLN